MHIPVYIRYVRHRTTTGAMDARFEQRWRAEELHRAGAGIRASEVGSDRNPEGHQCKGRQGQARTHLDVTVHDVEVVHVGHGTGDLREAPGQEEVAAMRRPVCTPALA
jgi:hypothetical protein